MRTGYSSIEALSLTPMSEFQRHFFLTRSSLWLPYLDRVPNVPQGILSDARYLDFISAIQMLSFTHFLRHPLLSLSADREQLLNTWKGLVGTGLLDALFPEMKSTSLIESVEEVYNMLGTRNYCLQVEVMKRNENELKIVMLMPCVLWSAVLLRERAAVRNDYDEYIVRALCEREGVGAQCRTEVKGGELIREWKFGV